MMDPQIIVSTFNLRHQHLLTAIQSIIRLIPCCQCYALSVKLSFNQLHLPFSVVLSPLAFTSLINKDVVT